MKTELVYFIIPSCNGSCAHCWSSDRLLGRFKPFSWHEELVSNLSFLGHDFREIKISGGEPFLHNDVGRFPELIHRCYNPEIPISIFTSGRPFIFWDDGNVGIESTYLSLIKQIPNFDNVSIQLSVDEFHINSLANFFGWEIKDISRNVRSYINNFIVACESIKKDHPLFMGPKLKIHCNQGRASFHKEKLFRWFPDIWWEHYAILTEGLISCGRGKTLKGTIELQNDGPISHFLLPGVNFYDIPKTNRAVKYQRLDQRSCIFLDDAQNSAVIIEGWWNLTNRIAKFESITF